MVFLYFHTIRYLKVKQIYYRIIFKLIIPKINNSIISNLRVLKNKFTLPVSKKVSLLNESTFFFLNRSISLSEVGWDGHKNIVSKLWRYNQHYFDYLNTYGSIQRQRWQRELLKRWVNENQLGKGVGWEPYPTSLRIVNWIKWYLAGNTLSDSCVESLALQTRWLNKRIEWHILGNHLFSNAKALVFAGLFFSSEESKIWLKKGLKIVNDEMEEQILDDGGHFERSSMYHAIFLEDILDIINISKVYPQIIQKPKFNTWTKISLRMLNWLDAMTHPDGDLSFFNDAALKIAPNLDKLKNYANRLGVKYRSTKFDKVAHFPDSGYIRLAASNAFLLLDVAPIGPDYLPGHAHADTLSFELSIFGQRVLVNGGTSEYGINPVRQYERSTKAHNTVVVNDENSSEVWSGFRVARRAYPFDLKIQELANLVDISCAHNGYKRLNGKPIHRRHWKLFETSLTVRDQIEGSFKSAYAYFHFHPSINIFKKQRNFWKIELPNGRLVNFHIKIGQAFVEESYYAPEFGKRFNSRCLKVVLNKKYGSCVQILW